MYILLQLVKASFTNMKKGFIKIADSEALTVVAFFVFIIGMFLAALIGS